MLALLVLAAGALAYPEQSPSELVEQTTREVLTTLQAHHDEYEKDSVRLRELISKIATPHMDLDFIGRYVLGTHWRQATREQKDHFTKAFSTYVINTYISAMIRYSNASVEVLPVHRQDLRGRSVRVRTIVRRGNAQPISIGYRLHRKDGRWMVVDVTVEGVSLVINYRRTFSSTIARDGIARLIEQLEKKNAEFAQAATGQ